MNFFQELNGFFSDPNTKWVLTGTVLLGLSSGVLGSFAFLRKRGLMGDVLAHAALPGICLAFMLTGSKNPFFFLIGATLTGILASVSINAITRFSRIKEDTALGLVLSVFFGVGIVFLTQIQHSHNGNQSGLDKFLFGQSASLVGDDVWVMGGVAVTLLLFCFLFFKEFKLLCFDPQFGRSLGFPVAGLDFLLMLLLVMAVVIGLQAAGVVLVAALIITPAAAARYWTERLDVMLILSAVLGALSGAIGTILSALSHNLPTGPLIVVAATLVFVLSLVFSPKRGLLARTVRLAQARKRVTRDQILKTLYESKESGGPGRVSAADVIRRHAMSPKRLRSAAAALEKEGLIRMDRSDSGEWVLECTDRGWQTAYDVVLRERLREVWMMHEGQVESTHRRKADEEIPPDLFRELWKLLIRHGREPKWIPYGTKPTREGGTSA